MTPIELATNIVSILNDNKAKDIDTLAISNISDFADTMIICTATSTRHCSSLHKNLVDELKELGISPLNRHNASDQRWVLLDYCDVVVHIMLEETRHFYELEKLWTDVDQPIAAEG